MQIMYTYVRSRAGFEHMPDFAVCPLPDATLTDLNRNWHVAAKQVYAAGRLVKKLARENSGQLAFAAPTPS